MSEQDEVDVQSLIKALATSGADPQWVAEAITIEQEVAAETAAAAARLIAFPRMLEVQARRRMLRVVAGRE